MTKTLTAVERDIRIAQDDDDVCRCVEHVDGFQMCDSCRAWQQQKQAELHAKWRREAEADTSGVEPPF